jgi:hypothetical protein
MNRVNPFQPSEMHFTTLIRQAFCEADAGGPGIDGRKPRDRALILGSVAGLASGFSGCGPDSAGQLKAARFN